MWEVNFFFGLLLLNLILWALSFKRLHEALKALGYPLLATLFIEGYAAYLLFNNTRNLYLYHILTPLQYALFSVVAYKALTSFTYRRAILLSIPIYLLISFFITLFLQGLSEYNSYALSIKNALLACWALLYYRETFADLKVVRLEKEPLFWVNTGMFFYSLGSFFVDGLMNQLLVQSYELAHTLYYINVFLGYFLYISFLIAFLLSLKARARTVEL
ncbi:hypothetical protein CLV24_11743 [Pontibacter ummariensis]|uniref:YhhN-like protein n=1 Tax=Pontibacter ummariensis TaxID=1610492 RepID=A0A239IGB6_9BACT|nr:hypothetical protein [Pontibacter ummariensis]PRY09839.1 hypothetical protein CLV24_11743 [Pontibacter ummariensis]SNS92710.1 hypothetical protein SAMN06296052_11743 [Pontibacter ummariensis]